MGKNSNVADSVYNTESIMKDESFKDLARYKCMASIFIKLLIPEFKDMSFIEIAEHIIDSKDRGSLSDEEIMQSEIDLEKTEIGTAKEKNTINDIVFLIRLPDGDIAKTVLKSELTVNFEMQNKNETRLIQRAIYYGASLLRDTVPSGDRGYSNIHKIYTIWFCNFNIKLNRYGILDYKYIHRYGMRRYYDDIPDKVANDIEADLINVTLVELPMLLSIINKTELEKLVVKIFYDTKQSVSSIESIQKINLTKYRKVVANRMDWEELTRQKTEESKQEGIKEGIKEGTEHGRMQIIITFMQKNKSKGEDKCKELTKTFLMASDEEIRKASKQVFND